ncbi:hypothetical protein [Bacillus wiedmannii]|uniref:hypothetical protein n=1 Tax=Bacillus wiedmannii TaxID=1890302 RepID=UPI000B625D68|nr:hypothetical protein [Bacillus wiedmannii]OUB80910.1 hypothetical protein BK788_25065 [Bacillus thuringiensis serovar sinensis]
MPQTIATLVPANIGIFIFIRFPNRTVLVGVAPGAYGVFKIVFVDKSIVKVLVSGAAVATYGTVFLKQCPAFQI